MQNISRRSLVAALGAAVPATAVPALANDAQASPRMLELKVEFDAVWARQMAFSAAVDAAPDEASQDAWEAWEPRYHDATDLVLEIMREPCASPLTSQSRSPSAKPQCGTSSRVLATTWTSMRAGWSA